jgi:hypothetical protein
MRFIHFYAALQMNGRFLWRNKKQNTAAVFFSET